MLLAETARTACDTGGMADDLSDQIRDAAAGPQQVTVDGQTVQQRPLDELIEADRYLASKTAATKTHQGLRFAKIVPPGAG